MSETRLRATVLYDDARLYVENIPRVPVLYTPPHKSPAQGLSPYARYIYD